MTGPALTTAPAPEDVDAPSTASHPGPAPAAAPAPTSGRPDYDRKLSLNMVQPGEPYFLVMGHDQCFAATVRAYAAILHAAGGPRAMVESALQLADKGDAYTPRRLPDADHLAEHERLQLEYQLGRRAWLMQDKAATPEALALAEERGFVRGIAAGRPVRDAAANLLVLHRAAPEDHAEFQRLLDAAWAKLEELFR